jgi:predicted MFS family arabinose efflux permease
MADSSASRSSDRGSHVSQPDTSTAGTLPRALIPIYGITFIDVLGFTIMIPLLPYFAQKFGASNVLVGVLMTTMALCSTVSAPAWGAMSDRFGRKRIVMISQCFALAGYVVLALSQSLWMMFVSRAVSGLGGGNLGVAQSYIADVTDEQGRDQAYALFGVVFGIGFVIGPVIGGFLIRFGFLVPFMVAAGIEIINMILTYLFLPAKTRKTGAGRINVRDALRAVMRPRVRSVIVRHFLFIFSVTYFFTVFSLYLKYKMRFGPEESSWLLAGAGLVGGVVQIAGIKPLTKRFGDARTSQIGFGFLMIAYAGLAVITGLWTFVGVLVLWAIGASLVEPTLVTLLSVAAPKEERGAILGLNDSVNNLALIGAPALAGYMIELDLRTVGIVPAVCALAAFLLGVYRARQSEPKPPPDGRSEPERAMA